MGFVQINPVLLWLFYIKIEILRHNDYTDITISGRLERFIENTEEKDLSGEPGN